MAKILVLGGLVAAERLAGQLGDDHQITLVSRSRRFVLTGFGEIGVGKCQVEDVTFDLRNAMLDRRRQFHRSRSCAHQSP